MRKSLVLLASATLAATPLVACGMASAKPQDVVKEFLSAALAGDYEKACSLTVATDSDSEAPVPATKDSCSEWASFAVWAYSTYYTKDTKFSVTGSTVEGAEAYVNDDQILVDGQPATGDANPDPIRLLKSGTRWLITDLG